MNMLDGDSEFLRALREAAGAQFPLSCGRLGRCVTHADALDAFGLDTHPSKRMSPDSRCRRVLLLSYFLIFVLTSN